MIPVRVQSDVKPVLASERRWVILENHPLYLAPCPVCDEPLGGQESVLVFVGIPAGSRRASTGWTTGAAVTVHSGCAGV